MLCRRRIETKSRSMYYGKHSVAESVGEGGESAFTTFKTSITFEKGVQNKQLLRGRGGRAVCQGWGGALGSAPLDILPAAHESVRRQLTETGRGAIAYKDCFNLKRPSQPTLLHECCDNICKDLSVQ